jgi:hypothetical protein
MRSTLYDLYEKKVEIARLLSDAIVAEQESSRGVDVIGGNRGGGGGLTKESLAFGHEISVMRVFHYLATDTDGEVSERNNKDKGKDVLGSSAHTDWGLLTLIMQDEVGGLQFIDRSSPTGKFRGGSYRGVITLCCRCLVSCECCIRQLVLSVLLSHPTMPLAPHMPIILISTLL